MQRFIATIDKINKMKYGKGTNNCMLEMRRKCGNATVKVQ